MAERLPHADSSVYSGAARARCRLCVRARNVRIDWSASKSIRIFIARTSDDPLCSRSKFSWRALKFVSIKVVGENDEVCEVVRGGWRRAGRQKAEKNAKSECAGVTALLACAEAAKERMRLADGGELLVDQHLRQRGRRVGRRSPAADAAAVERRRLRRVAEADGGVEKAAAADGRRRRCCHAECSHFSFCVTIGAGDCDRLASSFRLVAVDLTCHSRGRACCGGGSERLRTTHKVGNNRIFVFNRPLREKLVEAVEQLKIRNTRMRAEKIATTRTCGLDVAPERFGKL